MRGGTHTDGGEGESLCAFVACLCWSCLVPVVLEVCFVNHMFTSRRGEGVRTRARRGGGVPYEPFLLLPALLFRLVLFSPRVAELCE